MLNLILMPAYGKRYQTNSEALADWNAGEDFRVVGCGPYCSIRDMNHLQRNHHNVILHSEEGGTYVIKSVPPFLENDYDVYQYAFGYYYRIYANFHCIVARKH